MSESAKTRQPGAPKRRHTSMSERALQRLNGLASALSAPNDPQMYYREVSSGSRKKTRAEKTHELMRKLNFLKRQIVIEARARKQKAVLDSL